MKDRLCFVISMMSQGGAEKIMSFLVNEFSKKYDVYLIIMCKGEIFYEVSKDVNIIELDLCKNSVNLIDSIKNNFIRYKTLRNKIKTISPSIIISFLTQTNILSIFVARSLNIPVIIAERSVSKAEKSKIWQFLRKYTYKKADALVVLTKQEMKNYDYVKKLYQIYNPILIKKSKNIKRENIILAVGRLHPVKQFDKLIQNFAKINTDYKLFIVGGDGGEKVKLKKIINELKLKDRVFLIGKVKNIEEFYLKSKIFVLSSKFEAFPNVILEAMGYACAVVSFDCPYGPAEIIENGKNGILVENQNWERLNSEILKLTKDDNLRNYLSTNAIEVIERFSFENFIKEWEDVIENVKD